MPEDQHKDGRQERKERDDQKAGGEAACRVLQIAHRVGCGKPGKVADRIDQAMPPAAAVPLRNAVGNVQNSGAIANIPTAAMHSMAILCTGSGNRVDRASPLAATRKASAVFHYRSCIRSERSGQITTAATPTT